MLTRGPVEVKVVRGLCLTADTRTGRMAKCFRASTALLAVSLIPFECFDEPV